jgi:uncharacterized protein
MMVMMNQDKLARAIREHDIAIMKELLNNGASPNEYTGKDDYFTPLIDAIDELDAGGSIEAVRLLLQAGADVNQWNKEGDWNPLLAAMYPDRDQVFPLLLDAGANPDIQNSEGMTPLRWTAENNRLDWMERILQIGVPNTLHKSDPFTGRNPLGIAVHTGNKEMTKLLLAYGADPQFEDIDRRKAQDYLTDDLPEAERREWESLLQKPT